MSQRRDVGTPPARTSPSGEVSVRERTDGPAVAGVDRGEPLARVDDTTAVARLPVAKAYKMFVGGAFVRSESGRTVQSRGANVEGSADPGVVNVPRGSRKDARDAVLAAKNAGDGWAARTAYNRGQILYRLTR